MANTLNPDPDGLRQLLELTGTRLVSHLASLDKLPASNEHVPDGLLELLREELPEQGEGFERLLDFVFDRLATVGVNSASGGALSYIHGGGLPHSAVADLIVGVINPYVGYAQPSPGFARMEQTVIRWMADIVSLPRSAAGVLLSGGSAANFSAIVTARTHLLGEDLRGAKLYASDQVHHSIPKGAMLAGLAQSAMVTIRSDTQGRMDTAALSAAIEADRVRGNRPFLVIGNAGTTNTGAVDDLAAISELCHRTGLWFHVDAAYGGLFALTTRGKAALTGIELADTVVLNPHKTLFLPWGTGCLLARSPDALRRAHVLHADYIEAAHDATSAEGFLDFADLSPELTRSARGLRLWLPIKLCGANAFREALDEKLALAELAFQGVSRLEGFEIVTPPSLSTFTFRVRSSDLSPSQGDELNRRVMHAVNRKGRVHLSATTFKGRFTLRICVLALRTNASHIERCIEDLAEAARESLATRSAGQ